MPRPRLRDRQPDLFAPKAPQVPIAAAERRTELLALVGALLTQDVAAGLVVEASDEDHA